jgi:hypothetical protein
VAVLEGLLIIPILELLINPRIWSFTGLESKLFSMLSTAPEVVFFTTNNM